MPVSFCAAVHSGGFTLLIGNCVKFTWDDFIGEFSCGSVGFL